MVVMVASVIVEKKRKTRKGRRNGRPSKSMPVRIGRSTKVDATMGRVRRTMYLRIFFISGGWEERVATIGDMKEVKVSIRPNQVLDEEMSADISGR